MDLRPTEDQQLIRATAREVLQRLSPPAVVRRMERDPRGYDPAAWRQMAELGWMGLAIPERYGGAGAGFVDLCVLLEEQGRVRLPGPFLSTVVTCALPIARFGNESQKSEYLPAIAAGERILSYADAEPGRSWGAPPVDVVAEPVGAGFIMTGTKLFVPYAHVADELLVVARTRGTGSDCVTLLLVDARTSGITCEAVDTIGGDHLQRVVFDHVAVPAERVLGVQDRGAPIAAAVDDWGAAAMCAVMVGGAQRVLEMTVDYACAREQFGRPIGSFQAVQHHCANMAVAVETSRLLAYEAIWRVGEQLDAGADVSAAKAWVSDAYRQVCALGHQVHGAIGFTHEHDLQLYSRHARACELAFGDGDYHREQIARSMQL